AARRIALQEARLVEGLADAVDPAPAEHHLERLGGGDRGPLRALLGDLDPHLAGAGVVRRKPRLERLPRGELPYRLVLRDDSRHQAASPARMRSSAGSRRSAAGSGRPKTPVSTSLSSAR